MKILELRFKNLNSLYGEWAIDFSSGIFAITGPTGAGKSTILDAICLALYGSTPRLGKITKSSNEIMSRQAGECYAEVTFESQAGKFRCCWSQQRARKKADGNLVDSKHEIADAVSGTILESKKRNVANVIEEKTGMNFERFTRSILLAQGNFADFLKASPNEKAPILEQITGTEIYKKISKRVHKRKKDENNTLKLLRTEIQGVTFLNEEEEAKISEELTKKQKSETKITAKYQEVNKSLLWLKEIDSLKFEIAKLSKEKEKIDEEVETFKPEREKLILAKKAADFDGTFASLISYRDQQKTDQESLGKDKKELPKAQSSVTWKQEQFELVKEALVNAKTEQKDAIPLIKKVHLLDIQISENKKSIDAVKIECEKVNEQIVEQGTKRDQKKTMLETVQKDIVDVKEYLSKNASDESLVKEFAGIEVQMNQMQSIFQEISEKKDSLPKFKNDLESVSKECDSHSEAFELCKQECESVQNQLGEKKTDLKKLLKGRFLCEYRSEKDSLLLEFVDFESERDKLKSGKPCPLCGSKEHPFTEGNVLEMDETKKKINVLTELIKEAEKYESDIKKLEISEKCFVEKLNKAEKNLNNVDIKKENSKQSLKVIEDELVKLSDRFNELKTITQNKLKLLGIQEIPDNNIESILSLLKDRLDKWQKQCCKKEKIEEQVEGLNSEIESFNAVIGVYSQSLSDKKKELKALERVYADYTDERYEFFGSKKTDDEEDRLEKLVSKAEKTKEDLRKQLDEEKRLLNLINASIKSLNDRISKRIPDLQVRESGFISDLKKAGFSNEQSFTSARLPVNERDLLNSREKELHDEKTGISAKKKDRKKRLCDEVKKKVTRASTEDLMPVQKELEESLRKIRDEITVCKQKLLDNVIVKKRIKKKQILIDAQEKECRRWEKLHSYIGSEDGSKFGNFAQGLTFKSMVSHANKQLEKMTDRYLLIRSDDQPLELNVIDIYQAGEIRSTKNLSGGESFIVSLSLALGLSKMASRKVRVDSLFLDEGFCTLDEEALETALNTLSELQHDGKIIGIISHVPALKDRVNTQINVFPISGGKSGIKGYGCTKIYR